MENIKACGGVFQRSDEKHDVVKLEGHHKGKDMERDDLLFVIHRRPSHNILGGPSLDCLDHDYVFDESGPPNRGAVSQLRPDER